MDPTKLAKETVRKPRPSSGKRPAASPRRKRRIIKSDSESGSVAELGKQTAHKPAPSSGKKLVATHPKKRRTVKSDSESSDEEAAEIKCDNDSDDSIQEADEDDEELELPLPVGGVKWGEFYRDLKARDATTRGHFISSFFRYLLHVEGSCHSVEQALIQTRQVNMLLDGIDPEGDDLNCLVRNDGLDIWDKFLGPKLSSKELTGNTLKVYIRSLELFANFVSKRLFYNKDLLSDTDREAIVGLLNCLPDYRATIHRHTANQTTTRKVNDCLTKIKPEDIRKFEQSQLSKTAIKLLGEGINFRPLTKNEFTTVRDYLLVTALYENGSRPGPLENAKLDCFEQAEFVESKNHWAIVVDEHKTTHHQGPAEIVMDQRLYAYTKLYVSHLHPCFVASGENIYSLRTMATLFAEAPLGNGWGMSSKGQA